MSKCIKSEQGLCLWKVWIFSQKEEKIKRESSHFLSFKNIIGNFTKWLNWSWVKPSKYFDKWNRLAQDEVHEFEIRIKQKEFQGKEELGSNLPSD